MRKIDVCLTPQLLNLYPAAGKAVVVVDVLRATSCMVTALAHGVKSIIPVATLDECRAYQENGHITCAERDGKKADGFDLGNSPFGFMDEGLKGKTVVMTTTNGTLAISESRDAAQIIIGSFLNLQAVAIYLEKQEHDVLVVCAGWKGKVNAEDTLFAGALVNLLTGVLAHESDACLVAESLYLQARENLAAYIANTTHVARLHRLGIFEDIDFCLTPDTYSVVPVLQGHELTAWQEGDLVAVRNGQ